MTFRSSDVAEIWSSVYRDNLPDMAEENKFYMCNTDPSSKPDDHWVVLHATAWGGEYFDSLDSVISHYEFAQLVGSTDACPFRLRNYFLWFVVNSV